VTGSWVGSGVSGSSGHVFSGVPAASTRATVRGTMIESAAAALMGCLLMLRVRNTCAREKHPSHADARRKAPFSPGFTVCVPRKVPTLPRVYVSKPRKSPFCHELVSAYPGKSPLCQKCMSPNPGNPLFAMNLCLQTQECPFSCKLCQEVP
jgi:hypothetical protein